MNRHRVVITGMGVTSVLGNTIDEYWNGLLQGRSGIGNITLFDASDMPCQIAGELIDFKPEDIFTKKEIRRMPRSGQIALAAALKAVKDADLPETMPNPPRAGVYIGTAMGGIDFISDGLETLRVKSYRQLSPFVVGATIPNYSAFLIGRKFQCLGPTGTITTACATGTQSIGEGTEFIRRGSADIVIAGGTEAISGDLGIGGFSAMRALPTNFNENPTKASRPFDANREGFVLSEGAAIVILEKLEHAQERGATIYAEVAGHASSSDGYHLAAPTPDAAGPIRAMRWALDDGNLKPSDVDYINAHGTSTPLNDSTETLAIKSLFGEQAYEVSISSTKSMLGHAMGASGALEAIVCALAIKHDRIPPTINYENPDPDCDLDYTPNEAKDKSIVVTLSNSFGLGGQNACLVLKEFTE
ncbi:MAG: beta-ketoacyl-ACP synthase II [Chloroflexi bacterium]|nr:beta-ketoacyl-ACP synthase II [Chloroflexota bacterium]